MLGVNMPAAAASGFRQGGVISTAAVSGRLVRPADWHPQFKSATSR